MLSIVAELGPLAELIQILPKNVVCLACRDHLDHCIILTIPRRLFNLSWHYLIRCYALLLEIFLHKVLR